MSLILSLSLHANYLCEFLKVQWLHFTCVVDKVIVAYFQFFRILHTKNYRSWPVLTEVFKVSVIAFWNTVYFQLKAIESATLQRRTGMDTFSWGWSDIPETLAQPTRTGAHNIDGFAESDVLANNFARCFADDPLRSLMAMYGRVDDTTKCGNI